MSETTDNRIAICGTPISGPINSIAMDFKIGEIYITVTVGPFEPPVFVCPKITVDAKSPEPVLIELISFTQHKKVEING